MRPYLCGLVLAFAACGACTQASPERQVILDAADAMGGRDRIVAVRSIVMEGAGSSGYLGQDMTPEATGHRFDVTAFRRTIDLTANRSRTEQTRTPKFAFFQGMAAQQQVSGLDGEVGYNVAANGNATRTSEAVARERTAELYHHPLAIIRAALDAAAQVSNPHSVANERVVDVTLPGDLKFTLAIDSTSKLPTRVVSMTDNLNLGDVANETIFADYQEITGLKLPAQLTMKTDRWTTAEIRLSRQTVDRDVGDLAAPATAAAASPAPTAPAANVTVTELARGIWLLGGQSHHSVLVEFEDHLTLIEAPQNEARTLAVIAKAREVKSDKPLTHVVNTHHHFDHSAGIRAAVAEGLTVVTHQGNEAFMKDVTGRTHTLAPDTLAKSPKAVKLEAVGDELVLKDAAMTMNLYHVTGSPHTDTMLMAYFPSQRLLVQADAFSPGGAVAPYAANLLENIQRRKLRVDRIVPLHGQVAPFAELQKTVAAALQ